MNICLYTFDRSLKIFLIVFLLVQSVGVITGLIYLEYTTNYSADDAVSRYKGSETTGDFDIPDEYARPVSEMLITTHNHILGFSAILFSTGLIFYFNSIINGFWKKISINRTARICYPLIRLPLAYEVCT